MNETTPENKNISKYRIHLVLFRHDEKGKTPEEGDYETPLTSKGIEHAYDSAANLKLSNPQRVVTSTRERVVHTAIIKLAYARGKSKSDLEGLLVEDLVSMAENDLGTPENTRRKMVHYDDRLNFDYESNTEFGDIFMEVYGQKENNRTLFWQVEESDAIVLDLAAHTKDKKEQKGLKKVSTFTRFSGDMAAMMHRYLRALGKLKKVRHNEPFDIDILMGTHSQNLECFLLRLIAMKEEKGALYEFLDGLPSHKGFVDFSEGIDVDLNETSTEDGSIKRNLTISFRDRTWNITSNDLEIMIRERDEYNEKVIALCETVSGDD